MGSSFYSDSELKGLGIKLFGENVLISKKASIYGAQNIEIGNNVRIDDFCILSGKIKIGDYVHVAAYSALYGADVGIELKDYSGISARCTIYAKSDDFVEGYFCNTFIDEDLHKYKEGKVILNQYSQLGAHCLVLPGACLKEGATTGAMSLVSKSLNEWTIYSGVPAKAVKKRKKWQKINIGRVENNEEDLCDTAIVA
jgi:galactoside O-acetyltransferase